MNSPVAKPSSFLFTTWEGGGNIAPAINVARQLHERGHRVRFMCDDASKEDVEAAHLAFRPWREAPNRTDRNPDSCPVRDWEAANPQEGILRLMDRLMFGAASEYARDVIAELELEPADVVVTSDMLPGVMAACESRGQPMAILAANLCLYPLPGMPAFGPGLPPPRTAEEHELHEQIRQGTSQMLDHGLDGLNRARLTLGLLPLASVIDQLEAAQLYLLATSRAFDFPIQNLPEKIRYIGPQIEELASTDSWTSPWSESDTRPLVVVGFSTTYQDHARVLQAVIDATAALPVRTLVTLGQVSPNELRAAENTVLVQRASHDAVMRRAAVVVTHGGHGTVMRALQHECPMLILPHGRDQDENAIRVTERGAGLRLPSTAPREEIRAAIRMLLKETSFAAAARELGRAIAGETRDDSAAGLLEGLAIQPCTKTVHTC